jgi:hypothetical protein
MSNGAQTTNSNNLEQYRKTVPEFNLIISNPKAEGLNGGLIEKFRAIMNLIEKIHSCPKGYTIRVFDGQGSYQYLTKKHARSMKSRFEKELKDLKKIFKHSMKKKREPGTTEKRDAMNNPLYSAPALLKFLSEGDFGPVNVEEWKEGAKSDPLMNHLRLAKQGYLTKNTLTQLFYIYLWKHNLQEEENGQFVHFDQHMNKCFVEMPAEFYRIKSAKNEKLAEKILMTDAVERGLITKPLNTVEAVRITHPDFYKDNTPIILVPKSYSESNKAEFNNRFQVYKKAFANFHLQIIAACNVYPLNYLKTDPDFKDHYAYITNPDTIAEIDAERQFVKEVADRWRKVRSEDKKGSQDSVKKAKAEFKKSLMVAA